MFWSLCTEEALSHDGQHGAVGTRCLVLGMHHRRPSEREPFPPGSENVKLSMPLVLIGMP